ncbi:MMPL family transporter [Gammaproteobacteria bacterium]|nr:MMPL family transporter [Gammaproteobacteria bacterium]
MKFFFQSIIANKNLALFVLVTLSVILFSWIDKFRFDASSETLVLEDDLSYELYEEMNDRFSSSEFLVVALIDQDIFSNQGLINLRKLEAKLEDVINVSNVISILDAPLFEQPKLSLVKSATNDKYLLVDDLNLISAKQELIESPLFNQLIINNLGTAVAMQINLDDAEDYDITVKQIRDILKEDKNFESFLAGPAMIVSDTIAYIKNDVLTFGFLTFVVFFVLLIVFFRDFWSAFVIMSNASLVIYITICLLGYFDWPISIVSSNFLTLLFISSVAVSVHMIVKLKEGKTKKFSYEESLAKIFIPCLYTALTTMVGFLSLILSNIQPVIDFGKMMAVGVIINLLISFVFIPALIGLRGIAESAEFSLSKIYYKYLYLNTKNLFKNFGVPLIFLFLPIFIYLSSGLKVENKFIDYFDESTEIHQGMKFIDEELGGTTPIDIVFTLPEEEIFIDEDDLFFSEGSETSQYWWRQKNMRLLKSIQSDLNQFPELGKDLSIVNGVLLAEKLNDFNEMGDLELAFVKNSLLTNDKAKDVLNSYISPDDRSARITFRIIDSYKDINRNDLLMKIDSYLANKLKDTNVEYQLSGLGVLYNNLLQSLFGSQITSLAFVFGAIFLMLLILFRSLLTSLIVIFVPLVAVGFVFSFMSLFSIPLDIMTITIASISVGMSVDYAIHIAWRFREEQKISRSSAEINTINSSGQAVLITAMTVIVGFLVFIFSNFNPTVLFGLLSAVAIFVSAALALRLIPIFLESK